MLSKATIKFINTLNKKKFRQKYNIFAAEGDKICTEILKSNKIKIHSIYALEDWLAKNKPLLKPFLTKTTVITERELKSISFLSTPNKVMILLEKQAPNLDNKLINENLSLILNNIQDPGNLGTIWRIADWFDIKHVFCSPNCVDLYNNKVIQSSMGAFLRVPAQEVEIAELLETHSDVPVYGATLGGKNIFKTNLTKNGFIIIGNESRGIEANLLPQIDHQIAIPQNGNAESLNASVATGIICAAFRNLN